MSDLIDRQAAIDDVKKNTFRLTFAEEQNCEGHLAWSANVVYSDVIEGALLELPSAQHERNQGHWVGIDDEPCETWECDKCGYIQECFEDERPNFCPQCGADMRRSSDGQV